LDDIDNVRSNTTAGLKAIQQNCKYFENCFEGRPGAGIGAWLPKGRTLKATTVIFSNEVYSTFTRDEFANFIVRSRIHQSVKLMHRPTGVLCNRKEERDTYVSVCHRHMVNHHIDLDDGDE
jgi:hypothetical protein